MAYTILNRLDIDDKPQVICDTLAELQALDATGLPVGTEAIVGGESRYILTPSGVWALKISGSGAGVTDVQFNGTTCVTNRVASIVVSPNVADAATHTLQKLKIGNTQYKLAGSALSADSYSALVTALNDLAAESYDVGQSIFIKTLEVPDLWIYSNNEETSVPYTYVSDAQFLADITTASGALQIGYYKVAILEGEKVDLTNYVQKTDYATSSTGGVIKTWQGTQAEYDAITTKDSNTYYFISEV